MKDDKAAGATRQRHDRAFKLEAVRLWQSSGQSAEVYAPQLGVKPGDLYRWKRGGRSARAAGPTGFPVGQAALENEVVCLRQEVSRLTEQRDILKKAAGILCELPPRGMPGSNP
jgi:transposase